MSKMLKKIIEFRRLTIARRFILIFSIVIGLLSIFIYMYFPAKLKSQAESYKFDKAKSIAEMTSFSVAPALYFNDSDNIRESIRAALQNKDIVCIAVLDTSNNVVSYYTTGKESLNCYKFITEKTKLDESKQIYTVKKSIIFNGKMLGNLVLSFSLKSLYRDIFASRFTIGIISLTVFIIGIFSIYLISSFIVIPLKKMANTFDAVARGELLKRIKVSSSGEIMQLASSFNRMVERLQTAYRQLAEINKNLEDRVVHRTIALQNEITERRKAAELLEESRHMLQTILDNMPFGVIMIDENKRIIKANNSAVRLIKYKSESEIINKLCFDSICVLSGHTCWMIKSREPHSSVESKIICSDGSEVPVMKSIIPLRINNENILLETFVDITKLKEAEYKIKKLNKELEERVDERTSELNKTLTELKFEIYQKTRAQQALINSKEEITRALEKEKELNELKSRFISMVSHEYRTPLTVIMTSTYLLEKYYTGGQFNRFLQQIKKIQLSVTEMTALLENILFVGKSDAGKIDYNPKTFDLIEFCMSILHEVQLIDDYKHEFKFVNLYDTLIIKTDQKHLRHIISNLLSNAAKYSPRGETVILEIEKNHNYININVRDKGIGISPTDIEHLFEPFFRSASVSNISGTGLGLSIVKRCADTINAKISVNSEINDGTVFSVKLSLN